VLEIPGMPGVYQGPNRGGSVYHSTKAVKSGEVPDLYAGFLEELVAFLRAAVVYRPLSIPEEVFDQFLQLRRSLHRQR
jgi:hypothetical protein